LKKALTIGLVTAALAATLPFVFAGSRSEAVTGADQNPAYRIAARVRVADASDAVPAYMRGPRIIHVPQPGERARASISERDDDIRNNEDDDEATPPPRRHVAPPPVRATPRWAPRREASPPPKPVRRVDLPKFRDEPIPQPPGPRRAVLSAPPPPAEGPTPIRPLPKFGAKAEANNADAGDKFAAPRTTEINADTPPPGYTPPLAAPRVEQPDDDSAK
jgi:hypothetical protein